MSTNFVKIVSDTDLRQMRGTDASAQLREMLSEYGVVVFKGQQFTETDFIAAVEHFGELMPQQIKKYTLKDHPIIGYNSSTDLPLKDGRMQVRGENYHTDHSNEYAPPRATSLYGIQIPATGGDTQFVDVRAAYDDLPEQTKRDINGLMSLHVHQSSRSPRELTKLSAEDLAKIPQTLQPIVIEHPTSGRPALYLNTGRMEGIDGLPTEQAYELIEFLYEHATHPRYEYRHRWQAGDLVIWDNQSVMHQANADYDPKEFRYLWRLMVQGVPLKPHDHQGVTTMHPV